MSVKKARIPVTLESSLYEWITSEAKNHGTSISQAIRDAVRFAYEWASTLEILSNPEIMSQLKDASHKKDYVSFEEVKRSVYSHSK